MRTVDRPDEQPGLGPVKRPEPAPPKGPEKIREGVYRGPDGKLYTDMHHTPPVVDWFKGYCP